jgi:hypothetical protein
MEYLMVANPEREPGSWEPPPGIGSPAYDASRERYGLVMDRIAGRVWLRQVGGGREWEAQAKDIRPARLSDLLATPITEANARSRGEIL